MTVSGTPLSPSFGTQEGSGRAVEHLWRESPPPPQGTGTLLTLLAMTAWAPCSSSRDGQQFCGCHSHGFRMVCPRCDSLGKESPRSLCFILPATLRYVRHLHALEARKYCICRNYDCLFLMPMHPSGILLFTLQRYLTSAGWHRYSFGTHRKSSFQSWL